MALGYLSNCAMRADKTSEGIGRIAEQALIASNARRGPQPYLSSQETMLVARLRTR